MAAPLIAMGAMAALKLGTDYMAGKAAKKGAEAAAAAKQAALAEARKLVEEVGIPEVEALKWVLQKPEYAEMGLTPELLGQSALQDVQTDALSSETRKKALLEMIQRSEQGLDPRDKEMARQIQDQMAARTQASNAQNLAEAARQGVANSGIANMQKLLGQQNEANRGALDSRALLAQAYQARINAQESAGRMASDMDKTSYDRSANLANRKDDISKINQQYLNSAQQYNLTRKDNQAREASELANQEGTHNTDLLVDDYGRKNARAATLANMAVGKGDISADLLKSNAAGKASMYRGIGEAAGTAANAIGGNYFSSLQPSGSNTANDTQMSDDEFNKKNWSR